jgi:catechol 2,3-dioxygenase-like lactoylglutathione lyase family enzyme
MALEFRILGEVEALADGRRLDVGHTRQRCVLVALLVDVNHPVSADQLIDRVWADGPPHKARNALAAYISRLRQLVAGVDAVHDPYGNRDVKPVGLNHVVLEARDRVALESFYRDRLGFQLTDQLADFMTFFRCNANHHSLAFIRTPSGEPGLNHAAFEIRNWEEWIKAVFYAGEKGIPRLWGPGRHLAGNNLFSYYLDPEKNVVEYTAEVEQITDPNYVPKRRPAIPNQWPEARPDFA